MQVDVGVDSQAALQSEFDALTAEIDRIQTSTQFNGVSLFGNASVDFQVGTGRMPLQNSAPQAPEKDPFGSALYAPTMRSAKPSPFTSPAPETE